MKQIFSVLLLMSLIGCSFLNGNITKELQPGMSKADVMERLGEPSRISKQNNIEDWHYMFAGNRLETFIGIGHHNIARFTDGKLTFIGKASDLQK